MLMRDSSQRGRDYLRSQAISRFFFTRKFHLPTEDDSATLDPNLDYQDVKLQIVQQEGYDLHDFELFDDRSSVLWRKPYVDGAVRELTSGDTRSQEQMRQMIERMMIAAGTNNPDVRHVTRKAHRSRANVTIDADVNDQVPSGPRTTYLRARGGGPEPLPPRPGVLGGPGPGPYICRHLCRPARAPVTRAAQRYG